MLDIIAHVQMHITSTYLRYLSFISFIKSDLNTVSLIIPNVVTGTSSTLNAAVVPQWQGRQRNVLVNVKLALRYRRCFKHWHSTRHSLRVIFNNFHTYRERSGFERKIRKWADFSIGQTSAPGFTGPVKKIYVYNQGHENDIKPFKQKES
jgi:hypothetical protein